MQDTETEARRPSKAEIETHFNDAAGARPVVRDFDAVPGALCGNGRSLYYLTRPRKPLPEGWQPPPLPGSDPAYEGPEPTAPFKESPYALPTPQVVRLRRPITETWEPEFAGAVAQWLGDVPGPVGVLDGRDPAIPFPEVADRLRSLDPTAFDAADERGLAQRLLADGVALVLVDRTLPRAAPWTEERMGSVRLRLRDAGDLHWFHPVALSSGWALYRLAPPLAITDEDKRRLCTQVRRLLAGEPAELRVEASLDPVGLPVHRAVVSLRMRGAAKLQGRKLAKRMSKGPDVVAAVSAAAGRLRNEWAVVRKLVGKEFGLALPPDIREALPHVEVEIDVVHDVCLLADRRPESLLWQLQPGLHGILLHETAAGTAHYLEPSYAVHNAVATPLLFLEAMLKKAGLKRFLRPAKIANRSEVLFETEWQKDRDFRFLRFRTINWIETPGGADVVTLYRGVPLKTLVTRDTLVEALRLGAGWLVRNQEPDGQYKYLYRPTNPPRIRWSAGGNIVRHALNPYTLLLVNAIAPDPALVESARRGIEFTLGFLRWEGGRCVVCHRDTPAPYHIAKLGTNAVTILAILELGKVEPLGGYANVLRGLAEELLFMQDPNGHFRQYDVPPEHPYYGAENTIAPGEFILALARMLKWSGDARYRDAVDHGLAFHLAAWRHWRDLRGPEGVYTEEHRVNLVGIVPWLVMAMKEMHDVTGDRHYADIAFELQDWLDATFFYYPNRSRWPDWLGASFKAHIEQPAINSCQYIEGAAAAFALGRALGNDVERRRRIVLAGCRFCLQLQYDGYDSTFFLPEPEAAMGGFRYTLAHLHTRNDYSYHAMNALAQAVAYLAPEDYAS